MTFCSKCPFKLAKIHYADGGAVTCEATGIYQVNTIVHHDSETRTHINGYEGYGEYAKSPVYSLTEGQFAALRVGF